MNYFRDFLVFLWGLSVGFGLMLVPALLVAFTLWETWPLSLANWSNAARLTGGVWLLVWAVSWTACMAHMVGFDHE